MSQSLPILEKSALRACVHEPTIYTYSGSKFKLEYDPTGHNVSHMNAEDAEKRILEPFELEFSLHVCPISVRREVAAVFPDLQGNKAPLVAVPTWQRANAHLFTFTPESAREKDLLLERFVAWGCALTKKIKTVYAQRGEDVFCDFVDPCSGAPYLGPSTSAIYGEIEGAVALLRYRMDNVGSCNVISHPRFGSQGYPATLFTTADAAVVLQCIEEMAQCE